MNTIQILPSIINWLGLRFMELSLKNLYAKEISINTANLQMLFINGWGFNSSSVKIIAPKLQLIDARRLNAVLHVGNELEHISLNGATIHIESNSAVTPQYLKLRSYNDSDLYFSPRALIQGKCVNFGKIKYYYGKDTYDDLNEFPELVGVILNKFPALKVKTFELKKLKYAVFHSYRVYGYIPKYACLNDNEAVKVYSEISSYLNKMLFHPVSVDDLTNVMKKLHR